MNKERALREHVLYLLRGGGAHVSVAQTMNLCRFGTAPQHLDTLGTLQQHFVLRAVLFS